MVSVLRGGRGAGALPRAGAGPPSPQVFARDSSINVPAGADRHPVPPVVAAREYAPVIRFYQENDIPIHRMITAAALEGRDFMIVEPGVAVIGNGEERTQEPGREGGGGAAAAGSRGWLQADGWEVRGSSASAALPAHRRARRDARRVAGDGLRRAGGPAFVRWLESKNVRDRARLARRRAEARGERRLPRRRPRASRAPSRRT